MAKFNYLLMYPYPPNPYNPYPYPGYPPQYPGYPPQYPPQPQQIQHDLGDQEVGIENKKVGMSSKVKLNVKTALWIMGILWTILASFYTWTWIAEKNERKESNIELNNKIDEVAKDVHQIDLKTTRIEGQLDPVIRKTSDSNNKNEVSGGTITNTEPIRKETNDEIITPPSIP